MTRQLNRSFHHDRFLVALSLLHYHRHRDLHHSARDLLLNVLDRRLLGSAPTPRLALEHDFHLFERKVLSFRDGKEDLDQSNEVESAKDHVHAPVNRVEERGDGEGERTVSCPVDGSGKRHGFGADTIREDLGRIRPGYRAPADGEYGNEEVGAGHDGFRDWVVVYDLPREVGIRRSGPLAVSRLKTTRDKKENSHAESSQKKSWASAPFIHIQDGWKSECNVNDILNGCRKEWAANICTLHDICIIISNKSRKSERWIKYTKYSTS